MIGERIRDVIALHDERRERLVAEARPKLGWVSVSTPEEIIHAAGALPYRITGEGRPYYPKASTMMHRNLCPYVLSCFEEILEGDHDFAMGAVLVNACDGRRRMFDVWSHFERNRFIHMLDLPKVVTAASIRYFAAQLREMVSALEPATGRKVTGDALGEAIALCNRTRALLGELSELRRVGAAPISGPQAVKLVKAGMSGLRVEYNRRLEALLLAIRAAPATRRRGRYPVVLCGSYFDHAGVAEIIEANGAEIVCEDLSNGVKYFEGRVDEQGDPVEALARHYLEKATCARMADSEKRIAHLLELVERYQARAVVYFALKFCDNNLLSYSLVRQRLVERGIAVLLVEAERAVDNVEQMKTRIVAFLESQVGYAA
jgi:benzoyl-CoA reductase/2-hydroxyglutaryl-CoA dehydratase subunit BcrC/BadD/HgdB